MSLVYIIRHPETEWNKKGLVQGFQDSPLTPAGRKSAMFVARKMRKLRLAKIYSSDLGRCIETAEIIHSTTRVPVRAVKALREMDFGSAGGKTVPAAMRLFDLNDPEARAPQGESFRLMQKRIVRFVLAVLKRERSAILIVTHDGPLRALLAAGRRASFTSRKFATSARVVYQLKSDGAGKFKLQPIK